MNLNVILYALICAVSPSLQGVGDPAALMNDHVFPSAETSWIQRHNVKFDIYGNILARKDDHGIEGDGEGPITDIARLRQVDLAFRATIEEGVDTVLTASIQSNRVNTEYGVDVEEAYLDIRRSLSWDMPPGLSFMLGQFRTHFGHLNNVRVFDLPQINRPRALTQFFGDTGYSQLGVAIRYERELSKSLGVLNGTWELLDSGNPPLTKDDGGATGAQVARLTWDLGGETGHALQSGISQYHGRQADQNPLRTDLTSLDFLYTWRASEAEKLRAVRLGAEWITAMIDREISTPDEPETWYLWSQAQLGERWLVGAHYDFAEELNDADLSTRTIGATLTYLDSPNLRYSLGVETTRSDLNLLDGATRAFAGISFGIGSSPRRPFWVLH
jgi:hypothetical protein